MLEMHSQKSDFFLDNGVSGVKLGKSFFKTPCEQLTSLIPPLRKPDAALPKERRPE